MELNVEDAIDLLGNQEMPVRQNGLLQALRAIVHLVLRLTGASALIVFAYYAHAKISDMRESSYRKAVRRKYGIPDDDNDPFNVAYAKVRSRQNKVTIEDEEESSSVKSSSVTRGVASTRKEGADVSVSRRRVAPPQRRTNDVESPDSTTSTVASQSNATAGRPKQSQTAVQTRSTVLQTEPEVATRDFAQTSAKQKRTVEEQGADDTNGHADSVQASSSLRKTVAKRDGNVNATAGPSRGSKRQAASDEDISVNGTVGKKAGKRARRQSKKGEEVLSIDENDEQMDVDNVARGKKRDRTEAESSFGGDEDLTGGRGRKSRRHKRKSGVDDESATPRRGTKRSFEGESTLGSEDGSKSPRKRGKHAPRDSHDVSATESSSDASCTGRSIGEEWQAHGVTYKVGPNGQRLRQVLLKKRASRYSMPEDSQHPDSRARLEILVETWLNDEDYKAAEKRGEVYTPAKKTKKSEEPSPTLEPGKQLLWAKAQNAGRTDPRTVVTPTLTNGKQRVDPFILTGKSKRVPDLESLVESPTGSPGIRQSRSYSKWEKQDLEAEAMARLRKKLEEERKLSTPPPKVSFQTPSSTASTPSSAPFISTSSSAPASFAPSSAQVKPAEGTTTPSTTGAFTPTLNGNVAKAASIPTQATAPSAAAPSQPKPPPVVATPPQPPKAPSPAPISVPTFGTKPTGMQSVVASFENKQDAPPSASTASAATAGLATTQNISAPKAQNNAAEPPNPFAKPAPPSGFSSTVPTNGANTGSPAFSFGDPKSTAAPAFSFGKPADKPAPPVSSAFGAPTKEASGSSITSPAFGTGGTQPSTSTNGFSFAAHQNASGVGLNKPVTEQNGSSTTTIEKPSFNFNAGAKPSTPPSMIQPASATPAAKPGAPTFNFGSNAGATNSTTGNIPANNSATPSAGSAATGPKFSFGLGNTPSTASTTGLNSTGNVPKPAFGAPGFQTSSATAAPIALSSAPKSAFGAPAAQASTSLAPAQTASVGNAATGGSGTAGSAPATTSVPPSTGFNFGSTKSATPSFPLGGLNNPSFNFSAKPSGMSSTPFSSGPTSTTAPSAFGGGSNNTTSSSSPFGATVKPAGDTPKPFSFGTNNTTNSAFGAPNGTAAPATQTMVTPFSFGASSTPSGSSTQGGTDMFRFGAGGGSTFGAPSGGNANNVAQATGAFGSNTGTPMFGTQKT